jgi:hypothetical protein
MSVIIICLAVGIIVFLVHGRLKDYAFPVIRSAPPARESSNVTKSRVQIALTFVLLLASLYVVLSGQFMANDKHWAFGTMGTLLGFWFRPGK